MQLPADSIIAEMYAEERQKIPDYLLSKQQNNKNNGQKLSTRAIRRKIFAEITAGRRKRFPKPMAKARHLKEEGFL